ncbi:MAG TPA: EAL domain-containing protein [Pyrinomonadaceae bacterium]|jgi:diguanylate cyclase (GGDEF)-like protein|nr:EAL domain-containing protein [Pyrinomonadaceae bacterium]
MAETQKPRVLIIDDEEQIRHLLIDLLGSTYDCSDAGSAEEALAALAENTFDLVISDIDMGGMSGLELVPRVHSLSPDTVVVMISGNHDIGFAIEAMRVGAFDYISKPIDLRHVEASVERALNHCNLLKEKRRYKEQLETLLEQRTAQVDWLAYYDTVTQLPNRALFEDRLTQAVSVAKAANHSLGVLFLSVDQFKKVNDSLGHGPGDILLREFAERLKSCITKSDTVARFGSDEFALLRTQIDGTKDVIETIASLSQVLKFSFDLPGHELFATASVGVSLFPLDGEDCQTLLKNAGAALYKAKRSGGANYQFYTADMHELAAKRLALESNLRRAIQNEEFLVHYQPRVSVDSLTITGVEALVRWQHPTLGLISPSEFIPLAEDTGLIVPIGEWVLRTACLQGRRWRDAGFAPIQIAVNISARQFHERDLSQAVIRILEETGLSPKYLELELTESSIMQDAEFAAEMLNRLKSMGINISIDDFGTGFSSLASLKRLPIDALKIDQSFVTEVTSDADDAALVNAIITLAHNLRLKVIAEGVETDDQLKFLRLLRCDEIQGYFFSKPLPADTFATVFEPQINADYADQKKH